MKKYPKKTKNCDSCGKPYTGKSYPIVDEDYQPVEGLKQCEKCYEMDILGKDYKRIGTQKSPFGIGS